MGLIGCRCENTPFEIPMPYVLCLMPTLCGFNVMNNLHEKFLRPQIDRMLVFYEW
jgi:hypothetical protein